MAAAAFEHAAAALTAGDVALGRKLADEYAALGDSDEPLDVIQRLILSAWSAKLASETRRAQHDIGEAVRIAESDFLVDVFVRSGPQVVGLVAQLSTRARDSRLRCSDAHEKHGHLRVDRSSPSP